jgi:flavodoxin
MNTGKIGKIVIIGIILVIVAVLVTVGLVFYDVMSYTATGSQTLNPNGTAVGNALVVYDPGFSGAAKNVAGTIASDLQSRGYQVELAGIKSSKATETSAYDVIVVGGPTYAGKAASSVQDYLKALKPAEGTSVGIFVTGSDPDTANDNGLLRQEVANLPENSNLQIKAVVKIISPENDKQKITDFVNELLSTRPVN